MCSSDLDLDVDLELEVEPLPAPEQLRELIDKAERDCFIGASLSPTPRYRWRVNGSAV